MKNSILLLLVVDASAAWAHGDDVRVGTVREVVGGPSSRAELVAEDGLTYLLMGKTVDDEAELKRLAGVKVRLGGVAAASNKFLVERFEILDIGGGVVPKLGVIAELGPDRRLLFVDETGQAAFLPAGFTSKLKDQVGARVWVVGKPRGDRLQVSRFAILRPRAAGPPASSVPSPSPVPGAPAPSP